ncbi:EGF-like domain-containing protein [Caenorhabditis elegans]|nr:EGF-like domain-containing protein [Caenorhabditis elegans]CAJ1475114.1 EGF-like domain-containing protein [Caenorhabditis elegans]
MSKPSSTTTASTAVLSTISHSSTPPSETPTSSPTTDLSKSTTSGSTVSSTSSSGSSRSSTLSSDTSPRITSPFTQATSQKSSTTTTLGSSKSLPTNSSSNSKTRTTTTTTTQSTSASSGATDSSSKSTGSTSSSGSSGTSGRTSSSVTETSTTKQTTIKVSTKVSPQTSQRSSSDKTSISPSTLTGSTSSTTIIPVTDLSTAQSSSSTSASTKLSSFSSTQRATHSISSSTTGITETSSETSETSKSTTRSSKPSTSGLPGYEIFPPDDVFTRSSEPPGTTKTTESTMTTTAETSGDTTTFKSNENSATNTRSSTESTEPVTKPNTEKSSSTSVLPSDKTTSIPDTTENSKSSKTSSTTTTTLPSGSTSDVKPSWPATSKLSTQGSTSPASIPTISLDQPSSSQIAVSTTPILTAIPTASSQKSSTSGNTSPATESSSSSSTSTSQSTSTTTEDPACKVQCPSGYLIGTSSCFLLVPASSKINSYQSALSYCKTTDKQSLASLDKIRDNADIRLIQESAGLRNIDWIYANGIGGKKERFDKMADVYSIFNQTLVSSPISVTVGISEIFENISALCVLPQYCNSTECDVEKIFLAYDYFTSFKEYAGTLQPRRSGSVACLYGNRKTFTVTCNELGAIYPNPSNIDCGESVQERKIRDTTNEMVSSCKVCFGRGTKECQPVTNSDGVVQGYKCVCKEPFKMATCWRASNPCTPEACGKNGVCTSELAEVSCKCNWGYAGDRCEKEKSKEYKGDLGYSSVVGATITLGGFLLKLGKLAVLGFGVSSEQGDDPQDTHQRLRSYSMTAAGIIMCLYSNPTVFAITQAACRFYFIAIHFCYVLAMIQWVMESWNVNQILRAVHLNEWERDWNNERSWGVRIVPRMVLSVGMLAAFLLIIFQTGWNKLAATWTCVGVICQDTISIWFPLFFGVFIMVNYAAAIYESSRLIKCRRPLLAYRIDMRIERELGFIEGRRVEKCRDNELLSFIGLLLLIAQWISVIVSSDHRDEPIYGIFTVVIAGIYSMFCSYQEMVTCPEDRAKFVQLVQRFFPNRFAPEYNPETMWTFDEVREHYATPKAEREEKYEGFLSRNQQLLLHHRWDIRLNAHLTEGKKNLSIDDALVKVFVEEMHRLQENRGTIKQKEAIKKCYAEYMNTVPHKDPRDIGKLNGRLELVTLAAEDPLNGIKLAKFFIVPKFHIFEPEHASKLEEDPVKKTATRRLHEEMEKDIYELTRDEAHAQTNFMNSIILFSHYGNNVVR